MYNDEGKLIVNEDEWNLYMELLRMRDGGTDISKVVPLLLNTVLSHRDDWWAYGRNIEKHGRTIRGLDDPEYHWILTEEG